MSLLLRPSMLDDPAFVRAIRRQGQEASRGAGIRVDAVGDTVKDESPEEIKIRIYWWFMKRSTKLRGAPYLFGAARAPKFCAPSAPALALPGLLEARPVQGVGFSRTNRE